jgi:lipopolysaccharide biosynthesis glycosyltransferase
LTKEADAVHVVFSIYDPKGTYAKYCGVVMASIFERTQSTVRVHILHDETLTEQNRSLLTETAESFGQRAEFHDISQSIELFGNDAISVAKKNGSIGMLYLFLIPDALSADRAIYLDCDIIVNMDIKELWDMPLDGKSIAGVLDRGDLGPYRLFTSDALIFSLVGCDRRAYINGGVLLMDLPKIREKYKLIPQSAKWYKHHAHCTEHVNQDLINSCFRGDIKIIESRFNNCHVHDGDISNTILHAVGPVKPWNGPKFKDLDRLYWKTFLKTPWGQLASDEVVDLLFDALKNSPRVHLHTGQCYKKVFSRLYKDVVRNEMTKIISILCKELKHRLTSPRRRSDA